MLRGERTFAHFGFQIERKAVPIYEGHSDNVEMLQAGVREGLALAYYGLRGWLAPPDAPRHAGRAAEEVQGVVPRALASPSGPIVILGASYAAGWTPERLAGHAVLNRGIPGEESSAMLERFERDVVPAAPRAVILWGFINDIFRAQGDMEPVLARIRRNYTQMIALARERGIEPVLATEVTARPRSESLMDVAGELVGTLRGRPAYQDQINRHVMAVNQWVKKTAANDGLLVLDFQAVLSEPGGRRDRLFAQPDGSHITRVGYDALTAFAAQLLEERLIDR